MTTPLTPQRFQELVDAYGGDVERFPEHERTAARALLEASGEARSLIEAERGLDLELYTVLSSAVEPLEPALEQKLAAIPIRSPQAEPWQRRLVRWFVPGVAWAAAAGVGLLIGSGWFESVDPELLLSDPSAQRASDDDALVALALGDEEGFEVWP